MNVLFAGFQASLLWVCLVGLLSIVGFAAFRAAGDMMSRLRELFGKSKVQGAFAMVAICGLVMYGGSKGTKTVSFPRTDIERAYLVDAGSYVSNDVVHVAFTTFLVPPEAPIFLAYWPDGSTNEAEIVTAFSATLAEFPQPLDFYFENAISNRWCCYTTWTPGPVEQTNGVLQTFWMTDRREGRYLIPIHTTLEYNGLIITPFERKDYEEDHEDEDDD